MKYLGDLWASCQKCWHFYKIFGLSRGPIRKWSHLRAMKRYCVTFEHITKWDDLRKWLKIWQLFNDTLNDMKINDTNLCKWLKEFKIRWQHFMINSTNCGKHCKLRPTLQFMTISTNCNKHCILWQIVLYTNSDKQKKWQKTKKTKGDIEVLASELALKSSLKFD